MIRAQFGLMKPGRWESTRHSTSSMARASSVAMAAPFAPMAGTPSRPNMNTAFSAMLISTAPELTQALGVAWSVTFMIVR